ncbi:hypothetical protein [Yoonia sp. 208BN28-4]|uniref:hypothetical protein n=1 Tax=Yoonia sp. 208BN28-4 TaxID=3126505 RepID=UPI0030AB746B
MRSALLTVSLISGLSACGTATRTANVAAPDPIVPAPVTDSFNRRENERRALLNDFGTLDVTRPGDLPFTSRLQYEGLLNTTLGERRDVIGEVDIEVDTFRDTIDGSAGNFRDQFNRRVDGELELFRGEFDARPDADRNQAVAGVRGTLREGNFRDYAISGQLQGDVLGRDAQAFEGTLTGSVKIDGAPQQPIKGGVVAERVR